MTDSATGGAGVHRTQRAGGTRWARSERACSSPRRTRPLLARFRANCVVTKDVPDNAVVAGVPGRIISHEGSMAYVCWTDY